MICTCGDPTALGVVHLRTRPCFHYVERKWIGLTDEEKQHLVETFYGTDIQRLEAIEAKLKQKNT
jgi:hypothetical protein